MWDAFKIQRLKEVNIHSFTGTVLQRHHMTLPIDQQVRFLCDEV